jgi:molybdenum cofactor biosynthesis protein A
MAGSTRRRDVGSLQSLRLFASAPLGSVGTSSWGSRIGDASVRSFASAVPDSYAEEEESLPQGGGDAVKSDQKTSTSSMKRLEQLRHQLATDGSPKMSELGSKQTAKSKGSSTLRLPDAQVDSSTKKYTRDDWLALVDMLPDPPTAEHALQDRFHRRHSYLRLSLAERCNLRCTYCMPEDGVPLQPASHLLQTDELLHLASFFRSYGVDKFRLTGGEPTLRSDLNDVVSGLKALDPRQIGITTNGVALARKIPVLAREGLDSVNLSLDTLQPAKFEALTRRPASYLKSVYDALEACYEHMPPSQIKINCVLMRGVNTDEVTDFIELGMRDFPGIAVRFIEYMPFSDNGWELDKLVPYQEVLEEIDNSAHAWELVKLPAKDPHDTTKWYKAWASEESFVNVGFITSMSQPFCAGCNRLRLSADGQLKVCLFGSTKHDTEPNNLPSLWSLRDAVRVGQLEDSQLSKLVHAALQTKAFALGGHDGPQTIHENSKDNKPMTLIGG